MRGFARLALPSLTEEHHRRLCPNPRRGWGAATATGPRSPRLALLKASRLSSGFYLISPSEFERFSLSTKWLVEPRCLVDSAKTKNHNHPSNGNSTGPKGTSGPVR